MQEYGSQYKKPKKLHFRTAYMLGKGNSTSKTKMIHVKTYFKGMYPDNLNCSFCGEYEETLQYFVKCEKLAMKINVEMFKNIINLDEFEN